MIEDYYQKKYVAYEILKGCTNRDFSMLGKNNANIRGLRVRCLFDLYRVLKLANWEKHKQNIYRSVATLSEIPTFTFNPKKRSAETGVWYKDEYSNYVVKYDLFFDFDKEEKDSWEDLLKEVEGFKNYLEEYKVPYYLLFSGNKGFQIIISGDYLDIKEIREGNVYPHKEIVEKIKEVFNLKFLDLANNGVNSRLCKIPYSIVGENVALPLNDEQFKFFRVEDMKLEKVERNVRLIRRGWIERFETLTIEEKRRNVKEFINMITF